MGLVQRVLTYVGGFAVIFTVLGGIIVPEATVAYYKTSVKASFEQAGDLLEAL